MTGLPGRPFGGGYDVQGSSGQAAAERAAREARDVHDRIERLLLVNAALWSLIQDKLDVSEQDLIDRVKLIDGMDGRADGKMSRGPRAECGQCGRTLNVKHQKCLYCGAERTVSSAFELV